MYILYSLISVVVVSLISLIGVFTLSLKKENLQKILLLLVSFAVGGLFGDAFIHLIPEAFRELGMGLKTSILILFGIFIFFILEKFIRWRHCHNVECSDHDNIKPVVYVNLIGDAFHNLIDGMIIGASYAVNFHVGLATTLAVVLHEIPQEIGDFGVLIHGGLSVRKALFFNFLSALTSILGALISIFIGSHIEQYKLMILPVTAGGFIYMAGADLIPELHHDTRISKSILQILFILLGIGIMSLLLLLE